MTASELNQPLTWNIYYFWVVSHVKCAWPSFLKEYTDIVHASVAQLVEHHVLESVGCGFESHLSAAFSLEKVVSGLVLCCVALCCFVFLSLFLSI